MTEEQTADQSRPYLLYAQVEAMIRDEIKREQLQPGARLPTEADLCQKFNVSRSTIRQALNRLEVDGLITRTRGKGTFVRQAPANGRDISPAINRKETTGSALNATHKVIGLVFCARSDTLQMNILLGAERAAKSRGYAIMFGYSGEDQNTEAQEIERLVRIGADGVIVMPISNVASTPGVLMLQEHNVPLVLVDRYLSDLDTSYVVSNGYDGMYRVTEHLLILGYDSFAFITSGQEELSTTSVRDRYNGYCQALEDYGHGSEIKPPLAVQVEDKDSVVQFLSMHPTRPPRPLAIVAVHDAVAINLIRTVAPLGLVPPTDFAIAGFDDLPVASHLQVPLTTVAQPRYDLGFKSCHLLMDKIEGRMTDEEKVVLPVSLVVRSTCGSRQIVMARQAAKAQQSFLPISGV